MRAYAFSLQVTEMGSWFHRCPNERMCGKRAWPEEVRI